jgi:BirA family biotin operon repressor/biotin-[acetyl-CoA-carboxylase] ligase
MSRGRGIAMSLGRKMQMPLSQIAPLSLVVGVAVADGLERVGVSGVKLKWPNDVLLDGAKAGGILVEVANASEPCVVIGVGLNMGAGAVVAEQLGIDVGDLLNVNRSVSRNAVVAALIDSIVDFAAAFERAGFEPIRGAWERLHAHQNQPVQIQGIDQRVHGIARGVTQTGELVLETASGIRLFNSGEVSLRAT